MHWVAGFSSPYVRQEASEFRLSQIVRAGIINEEMCFSNPLYGVDRENFVHFVFTS